MVQRISLITLVFSLWSLGCLSQSNKLPPFRIMQSNGKIFKAEELPVGKPIILIYFSPECDHCEKLLKEVFTKEKNLKKASIALITFLPLESLEKFQKQFNLISYKNIYSGTEGSSFFVKNFLNIQEIPFVALYNKDGGLIKKYSRPTNIDDMISELKKLSSN
jgi:thioredoxin-related protein